ncbi:BppU family phage baseplate upper protein [Enterococcus avium]|uniref:BppU family phage baseplate upper protein n=1 Tax=Enterococcus avium TaxID=33945 RepID=UPI002891F6B0|nr:BppU family phage baseplate upper protein [Enterococcus avium]MDT2397623.1 BppU family phage baseplate upper protein [Enterococcus avium]
MFKTSEEIIVIQAEATTDIPTGVVFWSHDKGTAKLIIQLKKDHINQTLPQGTIVPILLEFNSDTAAKGKGRHIYHAVIENALEGIVSIVLEDNILGYVGRVDGSVYIELPDSRSLDTAGRFTFDIKRSPIDEDVPELEDYYWQGFNEIIQESKRLIDQVESNCKTVLNDLSSKVTSLENQTSDIKSKQAEILKSIEEHDVFTKEESSANVINQIGGTETAILKKEMLVDGVEGTGSIDVRDWGMYSRNYAIGTAESKTLTGNGSGQSTISPLYELSDKLMGKSVVISFNIVKTSDTTGRNVMLAMSGTWQQLVVLDIANIPTDIPIRITQTVTISSADNRQNVYMQTQPNTSPFLNGSITVSDFKIGEDDNWSPAPEDNGMVELRQNQYDALNSDKGFVRAETVVPDRGAEIQFEFPVIATLEAKYPYLFEGLSTDAEKVAKFKSLAKSITLSGTYRGAGVNTNGNATNGSEMYLYAGGGVYWGTGTFNGTGSLATKTVAFNTSQINTINASGAYRIKTGSSIATSDGVTPAWVEVKDIRLIVELEVSGRTIIEEMIAANHVENLATQDEAETGEDNTKTMTPLRVFQSIAQWTKNKFVSKTEDETVLGAKNFKNGLQINGRNVLSQSGEKVVDHTSATDSSIQSGTVRLIRYGDFLIFNFNFQCRSSNINSGGNLIGAIEPDFIPAYSIQVSLNDNKSLTIDSSGKVTALWGLDANKYYVGSAMVIAKNKL